MSRPLPGYSVRRLFIALLLVTGLIVGAQSCAEGQEPVPNSTSTSSTGTGSDTFGSGGPIDVEMCPSSKCVFPRVDCNDDLSDGCETDVSSDVLNCGVCGRYCDGISCVSGECFGCPAFQVPCGSVILTGECLGGPFDCETELASDPNHCGACGNVCPPGQPCVDGKCGCKPEQVLCGNICSDLYTDILNCGECGKVCSDPDINDDQLPRCAAGVCATGCPCGMVDCDNDPKTPCVSLGTNEHCSACNDTCATGCVFGKCCDPATYQTDLNNCGACGRWCEGVLSFRQRPDAEVDELSMVPVCKEGECYAECLLPYLDCNGDLHAEQSDFCETNGSFDPKNCGGCGIACKPDQVCVLGKCATEPCTPEAVE